MYITSAALLEDNAEGGDAIEMRPVRLLDRRRAGLLLFGSSSSMTGEVGKVALKIEWSYADSGSLLLDGYGSPPWERGGRKWPDENEGGGCLLLLLRWSDGSISTVSRSPSLVGASICQTMCPTALYEGL